MTSRREVILNPGDFCFGEQDLHIYTLLGSCVSITLWHPRLRIGGMCHYMLPRWPFRSDGHRPDGRYADDAVRMFLHEVDRHGTRPSEYEVKMFGGGNQFPGAVGVAGLDVARDNVVAGLRLLDDNGFTLSTRQVGGTGARRLVFDMSTGNVWLNCLGRTAWPDHRDQERWAPVRQHSMRPERCFRSAV